MNEGAADLRFGQAQGSIAQQALRGTLDQLVLVHDSDTDDSRHLPHYRARPHLSLQAIVNGNVTSIDRVALLGLRTASQLERVFVSVAEV